MRRLKIRLVGMEGVNKLQKKKKKRRRRINWGAFLVLFLMILVIAAGIIGIVKILAGDFETAEHKENEEERKILPAAVTGAVFDPEAEHPRLPIVKGTIEPVIIPPTAVFYPDRSGDIIQLTPAIASSHALLIDLDNNTVLAEKASQERIYPASMTKLMTLIVAIERIEDMNATFTMTEEILAPLYAQDASMAGFQAGEVCTMTDLLYGTALPSGADATTAIALHTAGSEEAFVGWMNEKVEELGLKDTHFMNASGLHHTNHYSTATDIALILEYCLKNELCKEIISTYTHTTQITPEHPEGITLYSTMFSRMYGTEVPEITISGGKTGFTDEAGQCLASYAVTPDGRTYIAVTGGSDSRWKTVYDAFKLYGIVTGTYPMDSPELPEDGTEAATDEAA